MRHCRESFVVRRIQQSIERMPDADGVRSKLVAQTEIQDESGSHSPFVMKVWRNARLAEVARRVVIARGNAYETERNTR